MRALPRIVMQGILQAAMARADSSATCKKRSPRCGPGGPRSRIQSQQVSWFLLAAQLRAIHPHRAVRTASRLSSISLILVCSAAARSRMAVTP